MGLGSRRARRSAAGTEALIPAVWCSTWRLWTPVKAPWQMLINACYLSPHMKKKLNNNMKVFFFMVSAHTVGEKIERNKEKKKSKSATLWILHGYQHSNRFVSGVAQLACFRRLGELFVIILCVCLLRNHIKAPPAAHWWPHSPCCDSDLRRQRDRTCWGNSITQLPPAVPAWKGVRLADKSQSRLCDRTNFQKVWHSRRTGV